MRRLGVGFATYGQSDLPGLVWLPSRCLHGPWNPPFVLYELIASSMTRSGAILQMKSFPLWRFAPKGNLMGLGQFVSVDRRACVCVLVFVTIPVSVMYDRIDVYGMCIDIRPRCDFMWSRKDCRRAAIHDPRVILYGPHKIMRGSRMIRYGSYTLIQDPYAAMCGPCLIVYCLYLIICDTHTSYQICAKYIRKLQSLSHRF